MRRFFGVIVACVCVANVVLAEHAKEGEDETIAEYILTLTIYRTTSLEIVNQATGNEFYQLSNVDQLAVMQSDPNLQVSTFPLRMVFGMCQLDALKRMHYAEIQADGRYELVPSSYLEGVMANLTYKESKDDPNTVELIGVCSASVSCGRTVFAPFPTLDAGKPEFAYTGGFNSSTYIRDGEKFALPFSIKLNEVRVVQRYCRPDSGNKNPEVVIATAKVEVAKEWRGSIKDIKNLSDSWQAVREMGERATGDLIITGK